MTSQLLIKKQDQIIHKQRFVIYDFFYGKNVRLCKFSPFKFKVILKYCHEFLESYFKALGLEASIVQRI